MTDGEMTKWINKERKTEVINVGNENDPFFVLYARQVGPNLRRQKLVN